MNCTMTIAPPEDLAVRAEKYAAAHGMTLEDFLVSLCQGDSEFEQETLAKRDETIDTLRRKLRNAKRALKRAEDKSRAATAPSAPRREGAGAGSARPHPLSADKADARTEAPSMTAGKDRHSIPSHKEKTSK